MRSVAEIDWGLLIRSGSATWTVGELFEDGTASGRTGSRRGALPNPQQKQVCERVPQLSLSDKRPTATGTVV